MSWLMLTSLLPALALPAYPGGGREIAPIIARHCTPCHQAGGPAPFTLATLEDVSKRAKQVAMVIESRYMPPWLPEVGGGSPHFIGERGLSDAQINVIKQWVQAGAPWEAADAGATPQRPSWPLGEPDVALSLPEPFVMQAEGLDVIRTFVFRNDTMEDRLIKAIDVRCSNPQALHHASFLIDDTGSAKMLDEADLGPGYDSMADLGLNLAASGGVWSVGSLVNLTREAASFSAGVARQYPADTDLVVEANFKPTGKTERLNLEIGLYLTAEPITRFPIPLTLGSFFIQIPAGEKEYTIRDSLTLAADAHLLSIAPRAHYICQKMNVVATLPS